ncbi:hypothetical protein JTP67_33470, partial [Streptomyces sp. S12]|nr:hypothetical protein [Streptomyces sp. S12]
MMFAADGNCFTRRRKFVRCRSWFGDAVAAARTADACAVQAARADQIESSSAACHTRSPVSCS